MNPIKCVSRLTAFTFLATSLVASSLTLAICEQPQSAFVIPTPQNTVLAWDLHDVLVKKQPMVMAKQAWDIIWNADNKLGLCALILNPFYWRDVYRIKQEVDVSDVLLERLAAKYPAMQPHLEKCLELTNLHVPMPESVEILQELENSGYANFLASNIGTTSSGIMQKKHSALFNSFKGLYVASKENGKKPDPEYYVGLKAFLDANGQAGKQVIFIDDKSKNVKGAVDAHVGITGIRFTNAQQLRADLKKFGFNLSK